MSTDPNAVSPLRRRMIEDMTIRRFTEKTQGDYIRHVRAFAAFLGRPPELAEPRTCAASSVTWRPPEPSPPR